MSKWAGNGNPGHLRRLQRQQEIEAGFDEPLADVIVGLREQDGGNSWRTVAGTLGVSLSTLAEWRKALGLPLDTHCKRHDPSSTPELTPCDLKAIVAGYPSMREAVIDLRLRQGKTLKEAAEILNCHPGTIYEYMPRELRGALYGRSERWWRVRRAQCTRMTELNKQHHATNKEHHYWNKANRLLFKRQANQRIQPTEYGG
jgi:hypothetical protein